jgi:hypothetical protein
MLTNNPPTKDYFYEGMYSSSEKSDEELDTNSSSSDNDDVDMVLLSELSEEEISSEEEEEEDIPLSSSSSEKKESNNTSSGCSTANVEVVADSHDSSKINKLVVGSKSKASNMYVRNSRSYVNLNSLAPVELQKFSRRNKGV